MDIIYFWYFMTIFSYVSIYYVSDYFSERGTDKNYFLKGVFGFIFFISALNSFYYLII